MGNYIFFPHEMMITLIYKWKYIQFLIFVQNVYNDRLLRNLNCKVRLIIENLPTEFTVTD